MISEPLASVPAYGSDGDKARGAEDRDLVTLLCALAFLLRHSGRPAEAFAEREAARYDG